MDIYERLKHDHETQKDLAKKLMETSGDSEERRQLFERLKTEAESHANAEEQTLYAELLAHSESQEKSRHSVSEHKDAADLLAELSDTDMSSPGWIRKAETLKDDLEHHIEEEENEVFKLARSVLDDEAEKRMVSRFEERKAAEA